MEQLPIFLDIRDKRVVVVGGGTAAARKADHALRAGARVLVLADSVNDDFKEWADNPNLTVLAETPSQEHFDGAILAYGAAEDRDIDLQVHALAKEAGVLVNIVDSPDYCDFVTPAVVDRDPLLIAISSSGTSPILARIIKARLETIAAVRLWPAGPLRRRAARPGHGGRSPTVPPAAASGSASSTAPSPTWCSPARPKRPKRR